MIIFMTFTAPPVFAGWVISTPGGTTIEVIQGREFTLRFKMYWDEPGYPGYFSLAFYWDSPRTDSAGTPSENFTFVSASAYLEDNHENIPVGWALTEGQKPGDPTTWRYIIVVDHSAGYPHDDNFYVDVVMRASGAGGVPHIAPDNHTITISGTIDIMESTYRSYTPPNPKITVQVLGRGVAVAISPSENSGPPGTTLSYNITIANTGDFVDNYTLTASDNENWGLSLSKSWLENVRPGENRAATLSVTIPENALGSTRDNITISAIGTDVENSASCIAHAAVVRGVKLSISPTYQENLPGGTLSYVVMVLNTGNVEDTYALENTDNEGWTLTLENASLTIPPLESRITTLGVMIPENAIPCTEDNISVTATSTENAEVSAENNCIAHVKVLRGVSVSISPSDNSGVPGATLSYTVTVTNTGNAIDSYDLATSDNAVPSWNPTVFPTSLTIAAGASDTATLNVTLPENAAAYTEDNITATATSTENAEVSAEDSCIAHVLAVRRVTVSISPTLRENLPGGELKYNITVTNTGDIVDNYVLTLSDNENWELTISPTWLELAPSASDNAVLSVIIPENAAICTRDNITVTATSMENSEVSAEDSCIGHVSKRGVKVSISPSYQENHPGGMLTYSVLVINTGALEDNYTLTTTDNLGWGPIISPTSLAVPAGENRLTTLEVTVPLTAAPCSVDNISATAISQADNTLSASDTCLAHTIALKTEETTVIYPTADVYAFGEYETGYSRSQLKFDLGSIPSGSDLLSVKLWLYRLAAENWDGRIMLNRVDNQVWDETITAGEFDAQALTNEENHTSKFLSGGWDHLDVLDQFDIDYGSGHAYASFRLRWANDNEEKPSVGIDDGRFLVINSELNGLSIVFRSREYDGNDPYLEVTFIPPYAVSAYISPSHRSGLARDTLNYSIMIINTGNLDDNYTLTVSDNLGWGPTVSPTSLTIATGSSGNATLSVIVPENATPTTMDNIIVTVTSVGNPTVSDSASCIAHRLKAKFSLLTLYKVSLDVELYGVEGSRLVVKFYTWASVFQAENVVWSGIPPADLIFTENASHPQNKAVENGVLVLTDDVGNVIKTIASFTVRKGHLILRVAAIKLKWPYASAEEKSALIKEMTDIKSLWPYAPD